MNTAITGAARGSSFRAAHAGLFYVIAQRFGGASPPPDLLDGLRAAV